MPEHISVTEAQRALDAVRRGRQEVIDEVDMPRWYWWSLALGWIAIGVLTDLGRPWLTAAGTFGFGTAHAVMYQYVIAGRRRTNQVQVSAATVGPHASLVVFGSLVALAGLTLVGALLVNADGAEHPGTITSVFVAALILLGGPAVMAGLRRAASRR